MWRTKSIYPLVNNIVMSSNTLLLSAHLVAQHCGVSGDVSPDGQHTVRAETGEPRARAVKLGHRHPADWPGGSSYAISIICINIRWKIICYEIF